VQNVTNVVKKVQKINVHINTLAVFAMQASLPVNIICSNHDDVQLWQLWATVHGSNTRDASEF